MFSIIFERYHIQNYDYFLRKLDNIEAKLIAVNISFDPAISFEQINTNLHSEKVKYAWSIHRIIKVFRTIIKGVDSVQAQKSLFPRLSFHRRFHAALPELNECIGLLKSMSTTTDCDDDIFVASVLLWEFLRVLNPLTNHQSQELWDSLYHHSKSWHDALTLMPRQLYSKLRGYFNRSQTEQQIILLGKIQNCSLYELLQTDVTPNAVSHTLEGVENTLTQRQNDVKLSLRTDLEQHVTDYEARKNVLQDLKTKLAETVPDTAEFLTNYLNNITISILACFDSPVLGSGHGYLRPSDKLKFIFDAIVFSETTPLSSELGLLVWDVMSAVPLFSQVTHALNTDSPGAIYVKSKLPNYISIEYNDTLYRTFTSGKAKKEQYRTDATKLIEDLTQRFALEVDIKKTFKLMQGRITSYQNERTALLQQILDVTRLLKRAVDDIVLYNDPSTSIQQFEIMFQRYFVPVSLEHKLNAITAQLTAITCITVDSEKLNHDSDLAKDLITLNQFIENLHRDNILNTVAQKFTESLGSVRSLEIKFKQEQNRCAFPEITVGLRKQFPYFSLLMLIIGAMGLALSLSILLGYPSFAMLILPILLNYTVPICVTVAALSAGLVVKASLDILRYRFFIPHSQHRQVAEENLVNAI